ncbi:transposase [Thalassococcus sp. S3]|uniref:REP-associated tyrosine transposase n=1 Tax=Thalassococcus sp. S3 TaxID=2017482 RepID=UPI0010247FF3|nr:transposase [Thalassococcus sp. S3]QBF31028.1 transposase [Thalassococcus sp. S3]
MPNYRRPKVTGATIFFTVALARRGSDLLVREVDRLRQAVAQTKAERPFGIDAWVVLPDHLHCVWTLPAGDQDFSVRWGVIKARFSMSCRRAGFTPPAPVGFENGGVNPALRRKGEIGLWQPRFWEHHIRDEADYWAHVMYCWLNPVKHGFVERPEDWAYSSMHWDVRFRVRVDLVL